jgi:hypothetical protein
LIPFTLVVLLLPSCSSADDDAGDTTAAPTTTEGETTTTLAPTTTTSESPANGPVVFEHVFDRSSETSTWTATGEAIDNGLLCPAATGDLQGFEDENGNVRRPDEIGGLYEAGEPFVNVPVELMTCDDGSGEFALRLFNEIDPAIENGPPLVASTWTITGGSGYGTMNGEGDAGLPSEDGPKVLTEGAGTITQQ